MDIVVSLATLLGIIVACFLLLGVLVSTPWQILLVLLVTGLVVIWWLMRQNKLQVMAEQVSEMELPIAPTPAHPDHSSELLNSHLKYRGTSYSPTAEPTPTQAQPIQTAGKYRGSLWQKDPSTKQSAPAKQVPIVGKYRGCEVKMFTTKPDQDHTAPT